jgi:hypothetical protein
MFNSNSQERRRLLPALNGGVSGAEKRGCIFALRALFWSFRDGFRPEVVVIG